MTKQIDELMALADDIYARKNGAHEALRTALEAALKPGEPVAWMRADQMKAMCADEKDAWIESGNQRLVDEYNIPLYTAAPPAQTPAALEPDHECPMCNHRQSSISYDCNNCGRSVQIEYTSAPTAQTPPPRLTGDRS